MERIAMSQEERDWLKRARDGVVTQRQAAEKMGITDRWVRKLLIKMRDEGDGWLSMACEADHRIAGFRRR
jgi:hypothetical protein